MSFLNRIIINILANSLAIWMANYLIAGFIFKGNSLDLLVAGAVLGTVNYFLRPVIKILSLPAIFLTLGLFTIIINIALLGLVAKILPTLTIHGFWATFWGVVIISIINHLVSKVMEKNN